MRLKLDSDFLDYYDHHFEGSFAPECPVFRRRTRSGMSRPEMMWFLSVELGLKTPRYGVVRDLVPKLLEPFSFPSARAQAAEILKVVVHLDTDAHAGEGKILVSLCEALLDHPNQFAVEHIHTSYDGNGISYRHLRIGQQAHLLRYSSANDWRSNCGDVQIDIIDHSRYDVPAPHTDYPLYAVDFICGYRNFFAVDFNIAPMIRGTGLEEIIPAREAFSSIAETFSRFSPEHFGRKSNTPLLQ